MGYYRREDYWPRYVSVAERRQSAETHKKALEKKGEVMNPVVIEGRTIARTFWGKAWCENLEAYSDYENRLPRGRTYVRNGSIIDLKVAKGMINAKVMGSSLYNVKITIQPMIEERWKTLVSLCSGKIDSLIELLQGKFSKSVMEIITKKEGGLFPKPTEISMNCSCPDVAGMCKHIAAVMYGIGANLDTKPESLFTLRHVDHVDLITSAGKGTHLMQGQESENVLAESDLSSLFGIELDEGKKSAKAVEKTSAKKPPSKAVAKANSKATEKKPSSELKPKKKTKTAATTKSKPKVKPEPKPKPKVKPKSVVKKETKVMKSAKSPQKAPQKVLKGTPEVLKKSGRKK